MKKDRTIWVILAIILICILALTAFGEEPTVKFVRWEMGASKPDTIIATINVKPDSLTEK